jgi:IS5 family transposase
LCEELELHLAYRWFCRLDLDDKVPDHSTFSVNRHGRFRDSDILRQVFEAVVRACMDAGLVKGEGFAVDASVLEANASRYHGKAPDEIDWSVPERQTRAAVEFLAGLDDEDRNTLRYRASKFDCEVCALKMQCCPNGPSRQIPRDVHEYARDVTRRLMRTKTFIKSRDERKPVEMRFAHLKTHHGFERMRLRGLSGAHDEFLLAAIVQNLKTLALRIVAPPPECPAFA